MSGFRHSHVVGPDGRTAWVHRPYEATDPRWPEWSLFLGDYRLEEQHRFEDERVARAMSDPYFFTNALFRLEFELWAAGLDSCGLPVVAQGSLL